ncbi:hypothetical protein RvY_02619 [Ramazzottius varieornatus]|uniref:Uncharacterized protein n=1 Tax=Ramazzottius varieornatus TaxID=947166 RepID=A0A1D1UL43_RAMVA|nr:hypothetical protein RvY_02619 [Ramazzottius varieornatus]
MTQPMSFAQCSADRGKHSGTTIWTLLRIYLACQKAILRSKLRLRAPLFPTVEPNPAPIQNAAPAPSAAQRRRNFAASHAANVDLPGSVWHGETWGDQHDPPNRLAADVDNFDWRSKFWLGKWSSIPEKDQNLEAYLAVMGKPETYA